MSGYDFCNSAVPSTRELWRRKSGGLLAAYATDPRPTREIVREIWIKRQETTR